MSDHDPVNKPSHYMILPGVEVYDVRMGLLAKMHGVDPGMVDDWSRAWEYLTRMWGKNGLEDAKKARWYLDKLIGKLEQPTTTLEDCGSCALCGAFLVGAELENHECGAQLLATYERPKCSDCGAPEGELHYVLCPRLPVPEAHAEAVEAAFVEQYAHKTTCDLLKPRYNGDGFLVPRNCDCGVLEQAQFDEARVDIIGQNGNDGEHYEQPVDVNDWRTWQVGDLVERVSTKNPNVYTFGNLYPIIGFNGNSVQIADDWGEGSYCEHNAEALAEKFEWHSRPAKTDE